MEAIGLEEARRTLGEIVERARLTDQVTLITRNGKPAAVVVNADSYEAMLGTIADAAAERAEQTRRKARGDRQ
jgi:prevent-host-death family protein